MRKAVANESDDDRSLVCAEAFWDPASCSGWAGVFAFWDEKAFGCVVARIDWERERLRKMFPSCRYAAVSFEKGVVA